MVSDGEVEVDQSDVTSYAQLRFSEQQRNNLLRDEGGIRDVVASIFVTRRVATNMRQGGLDEEAAWAQQFMGERGLFLLKLNRVMQAAATDANLESLAREYYRANPDKFSRPEQVRASHILVSTEDRTDEEALALTEQILSDLEADPGRFEALVEEYSDDPSAESNNGNLGFFSRGRMVKPFEEAAFGLDKPGELTGPIKTQFGYHIIRLEKRRAESKQPFEVVKAKLMEQERKKVENRAREAYLSRIRSAENIQSNEEAIESLVKPLPDPKELIEQEKDGAQAE